MTSEKSYLYSSNDLSTGNANASLPKNITRKELKAEILGKNSFLREGKTHYLSINTVIVMARYF